MADKINPEDEKLGQRLQKYRYDARVTQSDIAKEVGLSKNYISAIERGIHKCNAKTFIAYGKLCGVSLDLLALDSDKKYMLIELYDQILELDRNQQQRLLEFIKVMRNSQSLS